jgi:hypothetical protein
MKIKNDHVNGFIHFQDINLLLKVQKLLFLSCYFKLVVIIELIRYKKVVFDKLDLKMVIMLHV